MAAILSHHTARGSSPHRTQYDPSKAMKLVLDTLMIFFGTLAAAALVALGEPVDAGHSLIAPAVATPTGGGR